MKTIRRKDGRVWRVTDEEAAHLVKTTDAEYVGKEAWKKIRDAEGSSPALQEKDNGE